MKMRALFSAIILSISFSAFANSIDFEGASITAGMGASLPFELRVQDHISKQNPATQELVAQKKVLIALDYFFPTNFAPVNSNTGTSAAFQTLVDSKIQNWLKQNDFVIIGLLPIEARHLCRSNTFERQGPKRFV